MTHSTSFRLYPSAGFRTTWISLLGSGIVLEKVDDRDRGSGPESDGLWGGSSAGAEYACVVGKSNIVFEGGGESKIDGGAEVGCVCVGLDRDDRLFLNLFGL